MKRFTPVILALLVLLPLVASCTPFPAAPTPTLLPTL